MWWNGWLKWQVFHGYSIISTISQTLPSLFVFLPLSLSQHFLSFISLWLEMCKVSASNWVTHRKCKTLVFCSQLLMERLPDVYCWLLTSLSFPSRVMSTHALLLSVFSSEGFFPLRGTINACQKVLSGGREVPWLAALLIDIWETELHRVRLMLNPPEPSRSIVVGMIFTEFSSLFIFPICRLTWP